MMQSKQYVISASESTFFVDTFVVLFSLSCLCFYDCNSRILLQNLRTTQEKAHKENGKKNFNSIYIIC